MTHKRHRILEWKGLRNHLAQAHHFIYTDNNKDPAICKLMLDGREEIEEPVGDSG